MVKKIISSLTALVLMCTMLAGCGGSGAGNNTVSAQETIAKSEKGMTTIHIATTKIMSTNLSTTTYSYSLNKNGEISKKSELLEYTNGEYTSSESEYYLLDFNYLLDCLDGTIPPNENSIKKYRELINSNEYLKSDDIVCIMSINAQSKIERTALAYAKMSLQEVCDLGLYSDYRYDEMGNITEALSFRQGNIDEMCLYEYDNEYKITAKSTSYLARKVETNISYNYDSQNRLSSQRDSTHDIDRDITAVNYYEYTYNQDGTIQKYTINDTEDLSLYRYDDEGKLIKITHYNSDGSLSGDVTWSYEKISVPTASVNFLRHLYDHLGIRYEIAE